jgi:hypothetical protein
MNDKTTNSKPKGPDVAEIKLQVKIVVDKLLALLSRKYHFNFEVPGWLIATVALILLIILVN